MKQYGTPIILAAAVSLFFVAGCGSSNSGQDTGSDATTDIAPDIAEPVPDTAEDTTPDVSNDSADLQDADPDGGTNPDAIAETNEDAIGDADSGPADLGFQWAAGCEPRQAYPTWTVIKDTTFKRGPLIQMSDHDTVTVVFRTELPTDAEGCVDYTWDDTPRTACGQPDVHGQYEITINGLPAATEIDYTARVGELKTTDLSFRTMPDRPVEMKFAVFADSHANEDNLKRFSELALAEGVDFVLGNGDLSGEGLPEQYDLTFSGFRDLGTRVNIWTTIGNHDEKNVEGYFDAFVMPQGNEDEIATGYGEGWWSRRLGNVWIGGGWIRDFYLSTPDSDWGEVGWYRRQFETTEFKTAQWKLFFIHQPAYSLQWDDTCVFDGDDCLKVAMIPLLSEFGFQASFHGHMHGIEYGEQDGLHMFTIGGLCDCGMDMDNCQPTEIFPDPYHRIYGIPTFAIVESRCDGLKIRAVDLDGNDVMTVTLPEIPIRYDESIRLMSFNLRMPFDSEPGKKWEERQQPALNVINEFNPDIMVVQEGYQFTQDFIKENIPRLDWVGENRSGSIVDEYCAIFFDKSKYELIETRTLALSDTPEVIGTKFDEEDQLYPRIVTWGHFRRIADRFEFDVFSTHWDHTGAEGIREKMAVATLEQMETLAEGRPVLLAGDFNCGFQSLPWNIMTGAAEYDGVTGNMTDTWVELGLTEEGTYHAFTGVTSGNRIDWVMHNDGFKGISAEILKSSYDGIYPSDHFPIGAEFKIAKP